MVVVVAAIMQDVAPVCRVSDWNVPEVDTRAAVPLKDTPPSARQHLPVGNKLGNRMSINTARVSV